MPIPSLPALRRSCCGLPQRTSYHRMHRATNAILSLEERPGHHAKLYQYCSTDVNGMVQRHLRVSVPPVAMQRFSHLLQFDGERDTKGPPDFNNTSKADEAADEDDEVDDDDSTSKRRDSKSVKVKSENSPNSIVPIRPGPASTHDASTSQDVSNDRIHPRFRPILRPPRAGMTAARLPTEYARVARGEHVLLVPPDLRRAAHIRTHVCHAQRPDKQHRQATAAGARRRLAPLAICIRDAQPQLESHRGQRQPDVPVQARRRPAVVVLDRHPVAPPPTLAAPEPQRALSRGLDARHDQRPALLPLQLALRPLTALAAATATAAQRDVCPVDPVALLAHRAPAPAEHLLARRGRAGRRGRGRAGRGRGCRRR